MLSTLWHLGQKRDVGGDYSPSLGESRPSLALTAAYDLAVFVALELEMDATEILAKCGDVKARDPTGEVDGRSRSAKGIDLVDAMEVFGNSEADHIGRRPEKALHGFNVIGDQSGLVVGIESGEFGDGLGIVDQHD